MGAEETSSVRRIPLIAPAVITALTAAAFPQISDAVNAGHTHWGTSRIIYLASIAGVTAILFATLVRWSARAPVESQRPAKVGLVCSILGILGIILFYFSTPIVLGGVGATLGLEGRSRARSAGGGRIATAALVVGIAAFLTGVFIWVVA